VFVFGENSLDFVARLDAEAASTGKRSLTGFDLLPGGQGATAAIGCARLGARVCYGGVFGDDAWGAQSQAALIREGVELVAIERERTPSRIAVILVGPDGERTVLERRDPRLALGEATEMIRAASRSRLVLVDAVDLPASVAIASASRIAGARTVVDVDRRVPGVMDLLREIDVIVAPDSLLCELAGSRQLPEALQTLATRLRPLAIVATMGADGSLAYMEGELVRTPAFSLEPLDTTGAGDAFRAGLCAAWAEGRNLELAALLEFATATAALNCRAFGAQAGLPTRQEVERLLTGRTPGRSKV
jgi:ribokinase/sulfofructose kinase